MNRLPVLITALFLASPAFAQTPATDAASTEASSRAEAQTGKTMRPLNLDLRFTGDTDILLAGVDLGIGADFGLIPAGPGVLAVGAEFNYGFCFTACLLLDAITNLDWSSRYLAPSARVSYHFEIPGQGLDKLDLYGVGLLGIVRASTSLASNDGSIRFTGTDTGLSFGLGAGANYFVTDFFFVGGEARLRYAAGAYSWVAEAGRWTFTDDQNRWSRSGLSVNLFAGIRL